jgi:hypothetical protein
VMKANMRVDKVFISAVNAGLILSFACATYVSVLSSPWFQENAPGLIKVLGAFVFPYGTIISGAYDGLISDYLLSWVCRPCNHYYFRNGSLHWKHFVYNIGGTPWKDKPTANAEALGSNISRKSCWNAIHFHRDHWL